MCCRISWEKTDRLGTFEAARNQGQRALRRWRNQVRFGVLQYFTELVEWGENWGIRGRWGFGVFAVKKALRVAVMEVMEHRASEKTVDGGLSFENHQPQRWQQAKQYNHSNRSRNHQPSSWKDQGSLQHGWIKDNGAEKHVEWRKVHEGYWEAFNWGAFVKGKDHNKLFETRFCAFAVNKTVHKKVIRVRVDIAVHEKEPEVWYELDGVNN
jgi:hypothetical protein